MNTLHETAAFADWFERLKDAAGKVRILARLASARAGNFGDRDAIGDGVSEMRIHAGPGYRVYFALEGRYIYLLLLGGNKSTQKRDVQQAKAMWRNIKGQ